MRSRRIVPVRRGLHAAIRAVPSKSVTHRALVTAALASGVSRLESPLESDDTRRTRDALIALGIPVRTADGTWIVEGGSGRVPGGGAAFFGDSGTTFRLLTAVACLGERESRLDGNARLRERPVDELLVALRSLGARVRPDGPGEGLPLRAGGAPPRGGVVEVAAGRSSQFASALLLVAPCLPEGLDLRLVPPVVSLPYVDLTVSVMETFGAEVSRPEPLRLVVTPRVAVGRDYRVEGDHSSASYFLAAAAVCGGRVRLAGLNPRTRQADAVFPSMLESLGCRVLEEPDTVEVVGAGRIPGFDLDARSCPDLVPTLAALAVHAEGPCTIRGASHLRFKESDRLAVLAENLDRMGRPATTDGTELRVGGPAGPVRFATIRTAADHRIAMAFAVAGLRSGLEIDDPDCVAKSYPGFWDDFEALTE